MISWNKITEWKSKAGDISTKMKGFAKDLITVEEDEYPPRSISPSESPQKEQNVDIQIKLKEVHKEGISLLMNKFIQKHNQVIDALQIHDKESQYFSEDQFQQNNEFMEIILEWLQKLIATVENRIFVQEIGSIINNFFNQIQRNTSFYEKYQAQLQIGNTSDLLTLIDRSLCNTAQEIVILKEQQANSAQLQKITNENIQLQKKLVDLQDKITGNQIVMKESQQKIKDYEKSAQEWDKIRRDFIEEVKSQYQEIEQLKAKLKNRDQDVKYITKLSYKQLIAKCRRFLNFVPILIRKKKKLNVCQIFLKIGSKRISNYYQKFRIYNCNSIQKRNIFIEKKYEVEMKKLRVQKEEYDQQVKQKAQLEQLKQSNSQLFFKLEESHVTLMDQTMKYKELHQEYTALLKKVKQDQQYQNDTIDKRVIANSLITYLDFNTEYNVKAQILESLVSLLNLTEEEKEKIGCFKQKNQTQHQPIIKQSINQTSPQKDSLKDRFIGFLMNSD